MVRVISVHNFPKQDVTSAEEVIAAAVASENRLILALASHAIVIRNGNEEIVLPTVDQAVSVLYSSQGDYIATLEARGDVRSVRVYIGWANASATAPLSARIAGRVTPLSQPTLGVEMLEVPTPGMPDCIAVCSFSGNLLVSSQSVLSVFQYTVQTHDISRVEFVDLFKMQWNVDLGFSPVALRFCEDVIAAYSDKFLVVFRVTRNNEQFEVTKADVPQVNGAIDYNQLCKSDAVHVDFRTHLFPSVEAEPQLCNTPFLIFTEFTPKILHDLPAKEETLNIKTLIQIQLASCVVSSTSRRDVTDVFTCLLLRPYYSSNLMEKCEHLPLLGSNFYQNLKGIALFFGTQQEGYIHHYYPKIQETRLISVYPLTAPLIDAVLEDALLHALTEAGLETYTIRTPTDDEAPEDPICLLGLRPFLHVRRLLLGTDCLFLMANQDQDPVCTIYQLALADSAALWCEFLSAAQENQWEAHTTYSQLLRTACAILRTRRDSLIFRKRVESNAVENVLKTCYAMLGDYYTLYGRYKEAADSFRLAELKPSEVLKRIQTSSVDIPKAYRDDFKSESVAKGLVFYVKECLKREDERYASYKGNREEFYNADVGNLIAVALDVIEKEDPDAISSVILASPVIQQFSSNRCLNILDALPEARPADSLALALIYLQKGQCDRGQMLLASLDHLTLEPLLIRFHNLLFDQRETFSELALSFLAINSKFLAHVLTTIATDMGLVPFEDVLKILAGFLQNSGSGTKNAMELVETVIENQLRDWREKKIQHTVARDAVNTMTWLYLTALSQLRNIDGPALFEEERAKYLDLLPPFGPDFNQILSPHHFPSIGDGEPKNTLLKLQCLLSTEIAETSLSRVRTAVSKTPKMYGSLSIQIQCAPPAEAVPLLVNFAPQALIAYLKENNLEDASWRNLVENLETKISTAQDSKRKFYYEQLQNHVLEHVAQNMSLSSVAELIPIQHPLRNVFLKVAYNNEQAKRLRALIMMTGSQLL